MDDRATIETILANELEMAENTPFTQAIALALRYYDAETGEVPEGTSSLVSPDVRESIESSMAEIMGALNSQETLATFDPTSPDDVDSSILETKAVHRQIFGMNRGHVILETAIRNAMLQRIAIIRVDEADDKVELHAVAPENFRWSSDVTGPWLGEARFHAERVFLHRDEIEGGADVPADSPTDEAFLVRYPEMNMLQQGIDREADMVAAWICYLRDPDGGFDRYTFIPPSVVKDHQHVDYSPFACGVVTLRPHRFDGVSAFDRLQQIQSAKTVMLRQLDMQVKLATQCRVAIKDNCVNPIDLKSGELNPVIRTKNTPPEDILPIPIQDVTSQLLATLQWLDNLRREDGGASIDMTTAQVQIAGTSAHAAERAYSVKELQTGLMLRTIGETLIRSLYLLVHKAMRNVIKSVVVSNDNGQYYTAKPDQFPERTDILIDVGTTLGVRQRRLAALGSVLSMQDKVLQTGGSGILVTPKNIYSAQMAFSRESGLPQPSLYWTDPESQESQQAAQGQAQAAKEESERNVNALKEIEKFKGDIMLAVQHMKGEQESNTVKLQAQVDYFKAILEAKGKGKELDIQEAQLILSAAESKTETADEASTANR
jgi:hypothetical protein